MSLAPARALLALSLLAPVVALAGTREPVADPQAALAPAPHHPLVAHLVAGSLSTYHYAARDLDDDVADAWFQAYVDELDPGHLFLLQSDVQDFQRRARTLDDDVRATRPTLDVAFDLHARYRLRARETYELAAALVKEPGTFDDAEAAMELDRSDKPFPASRAEREAIWRKRVRAQFLNLLLEGETPERATEILTRRFQRPLDYLNQLEADDIVETYLSALAAVYDPHSAYFKPTSQEDFDIRMRDSLEGIGAELRWEDGYTTVKRLIPGGPAEAGDELHPGDRIVAVAQGRGEAVDVVDMRLDNVVQLIRGEKGSEVRLTIRPSDAADPSETRVISIIRDKVVLERASAKAELQTVRGEGGRSTKVGVIEVPSFYVDAWAMRRGDPSARSTTKDVRKLIEQMRAQGAESLVIDLRGNGGGALSEAISLTGLFIDKGPVVQIHDPQRGAEVLEDEDKGVAWSGPLVVLTDELSASASEIFAGAIQDYHRGVVVGAPQTHGKGTVQQMLDLSQILRDGAFRDAADQAGALKLTVQKFYRVSGDSTQTRGVVPDIVVPSPWQGIDVLESDLEGHLPWNELAPARYDALPADLDLASLRAASAARVASEPVFGWLAEDVAERARREAEDRVSLHRPTREQERQATRDRNKARLRTLGYDPDEASQAASTADDETDTDADGERVPTLDDLLDDAIRSEGVAVAADLARVWTPPASLIAADPAARSAGTGRSGRAGRP